MEEKNWKQVDIFNNSKPYQEKLGVKLGKSAISQYVNGVQAPDQRRLALLALTLTCQKPGSWVTMSRENGK